MNEIKRAPRSHQLLGKLDYDNPSGQQPKSVDLVEPNSGEPSTETEVNQAAAADQEEIQELHRAGDGGTNNLALDETAQSSPQAKPKAEIETLEQFIVYAYGLKGRRITLKTKVEQRIAANLTLTEDALLRLSQFTVMDRLFAVPRQLLLFCRDIQGNSALRNTLRAFVREVMLAHPLFRVTALEAAIRNLPEAPTLTEAIALVLSETLSQKPADNEPKVKAAEVAELRTNAAYCLVIWLVDVKQLAVTDVIDALNASLWAPRGRRVAQENAKLRVVTEIEQVEGVGLACELFRQRSSENTILLDRATREGAFLKERVAQLESKLDAATGDLARTQNELHQVRADSEAALNAKTAAFEIETAHLRDDMEQLRSRVLRRLVADVDQLEVGLSALRGPDPRIHVIQDRVERVLDTLRAELSKLKEG
jgi:hypothetical protein